MANSTAAFISDCDFRLESALELTRNRQGLCAMSQSPSSFRGSRSVFQCCSSSLER